MSNDILDLEEIALNWARSYPKEDDIEEIQASDIDWSDTRIKHDPTEYTQHTCTSTPKTHIISTCYFTNETSQPQVFNLISQRRTKSVCKISMAKIFTIGYQVNIKMRPPNPVVEANAGFKGELSVTDSNETTVEETILWSVDSKVKVPPKTCTKAELMLTESEFSSDFICKSRFDGSITFKLRNKKQSRSDRMRVYLEDIFKTDQGFRQADNGIVFVSKGTCKCRFGTEQFVKLSQSPIDADIAE